MKTFEEEYKELVEWYFSEQEKIEENVKPFDGGLDGEHTDTIRVLTTEYRERLKAIRKKHKMGE